MLVPPTPVGSEEGIASQGWGITMRSIVFRGGIASQSEAFPIGGEPKRKKPICLRQIKQKKKTAFEQAHAVFFIFCFAL